MSSARPPHEPKADLPARLRAVYEEHGPFVCRSLRHLGVPEADLDDLLQEVFVVVCQRLPDYEERGRARSWLYSICTRVATAQRRKQWRRRESAPSSGHLPQQVSEASQLDAVQDRQSLELGLQLLQTLPDEQREVFVLFEVEGLSMTDIAQALDCPLQTAYSRLYKARERILAETQRVTAESKP